MGQHQDHAPPQSSSVAGNAPVYELTSYSFLERLSAIFPPMPHLSSSFTTLLLFPACLWQKAREPPCAGCRRERFARIKILSTKQTTTPLMVACSPVKLTSSLFLTVEKFWGQSGSNKHAANSDCLQGALNHKRALPAPCLRLSLSGPFEVFSWTIMATGNPVPLIKSLIAPPASSVYPPFTPLLRQTH